MPRNTHKKTTQDDACRLLAIDFEGLENLASDYEHTYVHARTLMPSLQPMHSYIRARAHTSARAHTHTHTYTHTRTHTYACTHARAHIHTRAHERNNKHARTNARAHAHERTVLYRLSIRFSLNSLTIGKSHAVVTVALKPGDSYQSLSSAEARLSRKKDFGRPCLRLFIVEDPFFFSQKALHFGYKAVQRPT